MKNEEHWRYNKGFIGINYLVWMLRKAGDKLEFVNRYKPYTPITKDISNIKQHEFNKPYVSQGLSYKTVNDYDTIIIKGCTGTGKTTAVAKHAAKHMERGDTFLSITTRTSLSDQHQKSFGELGMKNYKDIRADFASAESLTIFLRSPGEIRRTRRGRA